VECIVSPDAGFQKNATKYQQDLFKAYNGEREVELAVMNKERDIDGKEKVLGGFGMSKISGKNVVIIDDETSSGGTLSQVASYLHQYRPKSILGVVTHLAGEAKSCLNSEYIDYVVVSDTVPICIRHPKLIVLEMGPSIGDWIHRGEENRV
jgi:phosphoribosylpyrophosphate synthetase